MRNILDTFKFLDFNGIKKLIQLIKSSEQVHWIGTQAEYEAQKANIPDGAIIALTDEEDTTYEHGKYATVETVTGKRWIDGKPIYRKVFTGNIGNISTGACATVAFQMGDMNAETITSVFGGVCYGKTSASAPANNQLGFLPFGRTHGGSDGTVSFGKIVDECFWYLGANNTPANRAFVVYVAGSGIDSLFGYNPPYLAVVEYTKTTD